MEIWTIPHRVELYGGRYRQPVICDEALMLPGADAAHRIEIEAYNHGEALPLSGSVEGEFVRADGQKVVVGGSCSGNVAGVTLAPECYAVPGRLRAVIWLKGSFGSLPLAEMYFRVGEGSGDEMIDPGHAFPGLEAQAEMIRALQQQAGVMGTRVADLENAPALAETLTLETGWEKYNIADIDPRVVRKGGIVVLEGRISNTSTLTFTDTTQSYPVATLPEWARPATNVVILEQGTRTNLFDLVINTDGVVSVERYRSGSTYDSPAAGAQFYLSAAWLAADVAGEASSDLEGLISRMEAVAEGGVRYDAQALTEAQQATARGNIGALGARGLADRTAVRAGKIIETDDAVPGLAPIALPAGATVYGRNMFRANITARTSNGVIFTPDQRDPNTVHANGPATGNAFSDGTITAANAGMLLDPGKYYICSYSSADDAALTMYIDLIDYASSTKTTPGSIAQVNRLYVLNLEAKSYVGLRLRVASGYRCDDLTVHIYASAALPDAEYYPYEAPDGTMHARSVVLCTNPTDKISYTAYQEPAREPVQLRIATYNVGSYDHGNTDYPVRPADLASYAEYIGGLDADILCTQEDRIYWDTQTRQTIKEALYDYLYARGGIVSNSTSTDGMVAKGIYSNLALYAPGKYTFVAQGTRTDGGQDPYWSSFTYFLLSIGGRIALILSAHLAPKQWNTAARKAQIGEILAFVADIACPYTIICGDFNVWSDEMTLFQNAGFVLANQGLFGEFPTFYTQTQHPFDNIIVSPSIKMRGVHTALNDLQDHYALLAEITV